MISKIHFKYLHKNQPKTITDPVTINVTVTVMQRWCNGYNGFVTKMKELMYFFFKLVIQKLIM
jgi:hypothetical protein